MRNTISKLRRNRRGAVAVEYALLLVAVAIPAVAGIVSGSVQMLQNFQQGRAEMLDPKP